MKLHELPRITSDRKRVGRSIAAGGGKTAGRGTKGQKARTGKKLRRGFEGGQMPLTQRLPKHRGFKSLRRGDTATLDVLQLHDLKSTTVSPKTLVSAGLIRSEKVKVKIIGDARHAATRTFEGVSTSRPIAKAASQAKSHQLKVSTASPEQTAKPKSSRPARSPKANAVNSPEA